jgi:hypothetical protein
VTKLVGVYDADGSIRGELTYFLKARFGRAHCALCDITHGRVRERADWRECRDRLPVPFVTYHRDDQPEAVRNASNGAVPVVLAETADGRLHVLAERQDLEDCRGSPDALVRALESAMATFR